MSIYASFLAKESQPSGTLWKGFAAPQQYGPFGSSQCDHSGNPSFGFYDDFHIFDPTTLQGPYLILTDGNINQIDDTTTSKGIVEIGLDGTTDNDESVLQWGRGLSAPFQFNGKDLVFECRIALDAILTSQVDIGVGLADKGAGATTKFFTDAGIVDAALDYVGFTHLGSDANASILDGSYQSAAGDHIRGDTNTKLNALHTPAVDTYVKLGFRYKANPETVEWYVNGVLGGTSAAPARLTASQVAAADFPGAATDFFAPILVIKSIDTSSALDVNLDWWACAQYL